MFRDYKQNNNIKIHSLITTSTFCIYQWDIMLPVNTVYNYVYNRTNIKLHSVTMFTSSCDKSLSYRISQTEAISGKIYIHIIKFSIFFPQ